MAVTRDTSAIFPVASPWNTNPPYSGNFIPSVWSAKLNAKFYAASVYGDIANTNWQGEISGMGDKIIINTAPTITVSAYTPSGALTGGTNLSYQVPTPDTQEMIIDKGRYFAFQINDVLEYQAKPNLLDIFSNDAAEQMRITVDSNVLYNTTVSTVAGFGPVAANRGLTAGAKSSSYVLGTPVAPVTLTASNVLQKILEMASVLDEQNVPETDRYLVIDPYTRALLMQSNLAQAQFMGDAQSTVRNGKIGSIDRFTVYVSNQLPKIAAGASTSWTSGDGSEATIASAGTNLKSRAIIAGHKSAITFASQITKMETVRNPTDFGDFIRSLNVYGFKVVKPESLVLLVAA
jgi:hypothetical protein